jgi:hypothetical protein
VVLGGGTVIPARTALALHLGSRHTISLLQSTPCYNSFNRKYRLFRFPVIIWKQVASNLRWFVLRVCGKCCIVSPTKGDGHAEMAQRVDGVGISLWDVRISIVLICSRHTAARSAASTRVPTGSLEAQAQEASAASSEGMAASSEGMAASSESAVDAMATEVPPLGVHRKGLRQHGSGVGCEILRGKRRGERRTSVY